MATTPRLGLGLISPGQAQKEMLHNEALQVLDLLVGACVEEGPRNTPPTSPALGACYIIGAAPTDTWAGKAHQLAGYTAGGWRIIPPFDGLSVYMRNGSGIAKFADGAWVLASAAIASPSGGTTVDAESRTAIGQILSVLRQHGLLAA